MAVTLILIHFHYFCTTSEFQNGPVSYCPYIPPIHNVHWAEKHFQLAPNNSESAKFVHVSVNYLMKIYQLHNSQFIYHHMIWMIMCNELERSHSQSISTDPLRICIEGLRNSMKTMSGDTWYHNQDSNWTSQI